MTIYIFPPLLSIISFLSLGFLTLARGARTHANRLFFILCLLASVIYTNALIAAFTQSAHNALISSRVEHLIIPFLLPLYIAFFHEYLKIENGKKIILIACGYAVFLFCLAPTNLYISGAESHSFGFVASAGPLYFLFTLGESVTTIYILVLLYRSIQKSKTGGRKNRLKYVLLGFGSLGFLNGLNFLSIHGLPLYPPGNFSFIPLCIFAVGLFKHDLLDMGILVKKSLIYSCLTVFLTCLYAIVVVVASRMTVEFIPSDSLLIPVGFFFLIAFIFGPVKNLIQQLVDKLFDKGTYNYRVTLRELSRQIVSELDMAAIAQKVVSAIEEAMKVECCALFIRHDKKNGLVCYRNTVDHTVAIPKNDPLVSLLKKQARSVSLKDGSYGAKSTTPVMRNAAYVFPLKFHNKLGGFLLLGEKRFGDMFTRDDLDLLETVCSQSALALENAHSYQKISHLNSKLEKKVADRTKKLSAALKEKEKTQEHLIRSESLAAIGQLVAGVAHEINNPLASAISLIQSTIEDLQEKLLDQDATVMVEDLLFIEKELNRAKAIVRSLLGLSRQIDTYLETVDLNTVIQDAFQIIQNQHRHSDVKIEVLLCENLPSISGNFAALGQVALNILQNAIHAVADRDDRHIVLSTRYDSPKGRVIFECADTGPGIPPDIRKDIFKPFFTTKDVGQGTGLGLYISHEIIRKHGGSLTFESEMGRGSRFIMHLPVAGKTDKRPGVYAVQHPVS
jgi:two-component system NtrC family sensor kinase